MKPVRRYSGTALAVLALGLALTPAAGAATITVDFNDAETAIFQTGDYVEDGVTMSVVAGHWDIGPNSPIDGTNYGNIDAGNLDGMFTGQSTVSFSLGGAPFSLVSILFPFSGHAGVLTPSGGGPIPIATAGAVQFFGIDDITSFTLTHTSENLIFDDIVIRSQTVPVPEPGLLLLLGTGLASVATHRRRTTSRRRGGLRERTITSRRAGDRQTPGTAASPRW